MKIKISSIFLGSVIIDQLTKRIIEHLGSMKVFSFMSFVPVWNKGVSFSMFSNYDPTWITLGTVIISLYVIYLLYTAKKTLEKMSLTLILAGAISNLIDRLLFGKVFDFIALHYGAWSFAVFNIADVCISVGAFILLLDLLGFFSTKKNKTQI